MNTADLIAFVRAVKGQVSNRMALQLADALEAAEAQRDALQEATAQYADWVGLCRAKLEAAEAQRDTLRDLALAARHYINFVTVEDARAAGFDVDAWCAGLAAATPEEES